MKTKFKLLLVGVPVIAVICLLAWYLHHTSIPVLEPRGTISLKERNLLVFTFLLGLVVIIPVFIMTATIAYRYREGNQRASYRPDWDRQRIAEIAWWGIPIVIIGILSVVTWESTYALNPFKPLSSSRPQLTVEVVSLDWKWLFIYPAEHIASVNLAEVPVNTPVNFVITSDTVMNSFWVPQLGGQIYSMPGMSTEMHLMATSLGSYRGSSANISGSGFAGMTFVVRAGSQTNFNSWVADVRNSPTRLTMPNYAKLARPSYNNPVTYYSSPADGLYDTIINKYMAPANQTQSGQSTNSDSASTEMQGMYMQ
jgi:cytochrome o ubiquinol oxidase subunit 2